MASRREARSNHFAAALLLSASYAAALDFEYCNKGCHYPVKVSGVEISPDPVVRGKPTTFKISASTVSDKNEETSTQSEVRREKITLKMTMFQDLVPGCNKVIGKALEKPRERLSVPQMEQDILKFLRDPRQTQFEF
ncbi:ML domain protein precursor [Hordeum vulgare]|nr:ML domain protein precursor [Hordeum vulgare]